MEAYDWSTRLLFPTIKLSTQWTPWEMQKVDPSFDFCPIKEKISNSSIKEHFKETYIRT